MGSRREKNPGEEERAPEVEAAARMRLWVRRARALGALGGFGLTLWLSDRAGIPLVDGVLRGLLAAVAFSFVAWWSTLLVLQALMRSAAAQHRDEMERAMREAAAAEQERHEREHEATARRLRRHRGEPDPDEDGAASEASAPALDGRP